jgi:retron-type reverse transcriptase
VLAIIRTRGARGLPLERLSRQLCNPQFSLLAYGRLASNPGAMTPGGTGETVDGRSREQIGVIINALRRERYRGSPVKRGDLPKKRGKRRPLGLPTWSDKLVAEVVRLLLEAYDAVPCSGPSHGFRPGRGCHTARAEVVRVWKGTPWVIEGAISDCFGSLDHGVRRSMLAEQIHDGRFLRLISHMLKAGYVEDWRWNATLSGAPQGGGASPLLSTIYLDRLDPCVDQLRLPEYTHRRLRRRNPTYQTVESGLQRAKRHGDREAVRRLRGQRRTLPSPDPNDPHYRRRRDGRYADDWLLGFAGPKHEAKAIKSRIRAFLHNELARELSASTTLITHATSQAARFLGDEVRAPHADDKLDRRGQRAVKAAIGLFVPKQVLRQRRACYLSEGKPAQRGARLHDDDFTIVAKSQAEYRGLVQSSLLAQDVFRLGKLHWVMETALLKTLARKPRSTVMKRARKSKATIEPPEGPRACLQVTVERDGGRKPLVARFGGIPLRRQRTAVLTDVSPVMASTRRNELIHRLLPEGCEVCDAQGHLEVHHVRTLADLNQPGRRERPAWRHLMAKRRRTTLVVCRRCHEAIHAGRATVPVRK